MVTLIEALIGKGYQLSIFDREVSLARLFGANKEYIEREIPHISELMHENLQQVMDNSDIIVLGKDGADFRDIGTQLRDDQTLIDLVRVPYFSSSERSYEGICW